MIFNQLLIAFSKYILNKISVENQMKQVYSNKTRYDSNFLGEY